MRSVPLSLIAAIALMLLAAPAGATITYFPSQSQWEAATSNIFTINFDDLSVTNYADYTATGLQVYDPVVFSATDNLKVYNADWTGSGHGVPAAWTGNYLFGSGYGKNIHVALPANVYAVAAEVFTLPFGSNMNFAFSGGGTYGPIGTPASARVFAGFTSDHPISWVEFSAVNYYTALDNFKYSQLDEVTETPEASTLLFGGLGLASLLAARRLRGAC